MSHFAKVENGIVTKVIVAEKEFFDTFVDDSPGEWIQTSYNDNFRGRFAIVGGIYDRERDVFYERQPYASWILDDNYNWQAPINYPIDNKLYNWNVQDQEWQENN